MNLEMHNKVTTSHLRRAAYLYVRQSTLRQVLENTESTKRQYALRERAVALGWPNDRVVVIDSDLGQSGADSDRVGFQRLVAAVGMAEVGVVLGLEVSRLARSSSDWHRLLEICALTDTLILDEDGLYNPGHFNDRLLLGLKGTMSEAELHILRARLIGGQLAKASRGELEMKLPVGLVYDGNGAVVLDPDAQVQDALRTFFETFRRTGSATGTVRSFRERGLLFPHRQQSGPHQGELAWGELVHSRALRVLQNPRYAGAFVYGRSQTLKKADGRERRRPLPQDQWHTLIRDAHPGYITWSDYEENLRRLRENAQAYGLDRRQGPPREGSALLQGLVICARCGGRMTVGYYSSHQQIQPEYRCQRDGIEHAKGLCQRMLGGALDRAIGELLVETMTPLALEVALSVQDELVARADEVDRLRRQQVERTESFGGPDRITRELGFQHNHRRPPTPSDHGRSARPIRGSVPRGSRQGRALPTSNPSGKPFATILSSVHLSLNRTHGRRRMPIFTLSAASPAGSGRIPRAARQNSGRHTTSFD